MITKLVRIIGIFILVLFSTVSVFLSMAEREIHDSQMSNLLSYPVFFENRFFDFRMGLTLDPSKKDKQMVLAAIDNKALKEIGRWPWPRRIWRDLVLKLKKYDAKILAFDVFFSEPELACSGESPDLDFANALANFQDKPGNRIILPYSLNTSDSEFFDDIPDSLFDFIMDTKQAGGANLRENYISKTVYPLKQFIDAGVALGHIEAEADKDGIFRHYPFLANVQTLYFPSYGLLAYQYFTDDRPILEVDELGTGLLKLRDGAINLNHKGEAKIRWLGGIENFDIVGIYEILQAPDDDPKMKELLGGRIVFIGSTAFGAHDLRHTPVDPMLPGVFFHMNMTHMLLDNMFFKPKDESTILTWWMLLGATAIMILIPIMGLAFLDAATVIVLSSGLFLYDSYILIPAGYEIKLFFVIFSVVSVYLFTTILNFYLSNKDKSFLKNAFGNYISPELIDEMFATGEPPKLGGHCDLITAYFTDIQSFSTFSEKLSATELVELLNEYLQEMTDILLSEGGTLDKYEGDAIIAFIGAPMPLEDHAVRACRIAHRMQEALLVLRKKWVSEGDKWPECVKNMRMRIGINSGEIVTGNMGSSTRMNYTMMGDSVNLAARLEEAAKQYGIFTQISHFTKDLTGDHFEMRELDTIRVVGKSEPVTTYDLLGETGKLSEDMQRLKEVFDKGLGLYKELKWDLAIETFKQSLEYEYKRFPDLQEKPNPSKIYIARCEEFKVNPPPKDWDGVYTLTSK